jgi:hypothetical protein
VAGPTNSRPAADDLDYVGVKPTGLSTTSTPETTFFI